MIDGVLQLVNGTGAHNYKRCERTVKVQHKVCIELNLEPITFKRN